MPRRKEYLDHATKSLVGGVALAVGFVAVIWLLRLIHPGLANDMLGGMQNHP